MTMEYNQDILEFWMADDMKNILPKNRNNEFPEGFDVLAVLREIVQNDTINEIGCGYGRLVKAFSPSQYTGFDINPNCVQLAKELNPDYTFKVSDVDVDLPTSDWVLMYTLALHIPEENLRDFIQRCVNNSKKILLAEIMGRVRWKQKHGKLKFAFNRDPEEYIELFESLGFALSEHIQHPYAAYEDAELTMLLFER